MTKTITVNADALYEVLQALVGPGHHIRELQATRSLHKLGHPNPIDTLIEDYEASRAAPTAAEPAGEAVAEQQWIEQSKHLNCPVCGGSGHIDDVMPLGDAAHNALLELVMLKEMKDKWEAEELSGFAYQSTDNHRLHNEQRANYLRRKPLAWAAACRALAASPSPGVREE